MVEALYEKGLANGGKKARAIALKTINAANRFEAKKRGIAFTKAIGEAPEVKAVRVATNAAFAAVVLVGMVVGTLLFVWLAGFLAFEAMFSASFWGYMAFVAVIVGIGLYFIRREEEPQD